MRDLKDLTWMLRVADAAGRIACYTLLLVLLTLGVGPLVATLLRLLGAL